MQEVKDSKQAIVRIGYDGKVHKSFRGPMARERYQNEVAVLKYLEGLKCNFVPRVLETDEATLSLVTTNCGAIVNKISQEKMDQLFMELEQYGVRHEDRFARNVTYNSDLGRFCLIDFEFATILSSGVGLKLEDVEAFNEENKKQMSEEKLKKAEEGRKA